MILSRPSGADILCASASATTATLLTVPANRWYTANVCISASANLNVTATPALTWTPNDGSAGPATTTVVSRCTVISINSAPQSNSATNHIVVYGGASGGVLSFAINSSTAASISVNGFLL